MKWLPIDQLENIHQHPLWIASPKLVDPDRNPLGIAEGFWQDGEGWKTTEFDMCNDVWNTIILVKEDVTHVLIPAGPWTAEELEKIDEDRR